MRRLLLPGTSRRSRWLGSSLQHANPGSQRFQHSSSPQQRLKVGLMVCLLSQICLKYCHQKQPYSLPPPPLLLLPGHGLEADLPPGQLGPSQRRRRWPLPLQQPQRQQRRLLRLRRGLLRKLRRLERPPTSQSSV